MHVMQSLWTSELQTISEFRKNPDDYKILDKEISSEQYAVGFKKGNTELKDKVQKTLDEMAEDGTVDKIAEKYADYGVPGALCIGKNSK